jgi:hypothetical protein
LPYTNFLGGNLTKDERFYVTIQCPFEIEKSNMATEVVRVCGGGEEEEAVCTLFWVNPCTTRNVLTSDLLIVTMNEIIIEL